MDATDIKVYEIFKNHFSDQEAEVVMTYLEDKTTEKAETYSRTLASQSDILKLRQDVQTDIVKLRQDVQTDIANLRQDVQTDIATLRQDVQTNIAKLRQDVQTDILKLKSDITDLRAEMKAEFSNVKTDIVRWLVVTMIALAGVIIAVVKLF